MFWYLFKSCTDSSVLSKNSPTFSPLPEIPYVDIVCVCVCVCKSLSHVQVFGTASTVACQASLSMEFSRQEYQLRDQIQVSCIAGKQILYHCTSWEVLICRNKDYHFHWHFLCSTHFSISMAICSMNSLRVFLCIPFPSLTNQSWENVSKFLHKMT